MAKLTDKDIRDLTVPEGAKDIQAFDDELPGFGVRKFASGKTSLSTLSASSSDVRRLVRGLLARCRPSARKQPWSWLKPGSARMSSERLGMLSSKLPTRRRSVSSSAPTLSCAKRATNSGKPCGRSPMSRRRDIFSDLGGLYTTSQ